MSVGKVPGKTEGMAQSSLEGNHDNLVSGTHQAPSYWVEKCTDTYQKTPRGKGGLGAKNAKATVHKKPT